MFLHYLLVTSLSIQIEKQTSIQKFNHSFFENKCTILLQNMPELRHVGLLDPMGNQVAGGFKHGIKLLMTLDERKKMNIEAVLRVKTRQDFDEKLGSVTYAAARRSTVVMMSFLMGDYVLIVSANKDVEIDETARKIMNLWGISN